VYYFNVTIFWGTCHICHLPCLKSVPSTHFPPSTNCYLWYFYLFTFAGNTENLCQVPWDALEHTLPAQGARLTWLETPKTQLNSTRLDLKARLVANLEEAPPDVSGNYAYLSSFVYNRFASLKASFQLNYLCKLDCVGVWCSILTFANITSSSCQVGFYTFWPLLATKMCLKNTYLSKHINRGSAPIIGSLRACHMYMLLLWINATLLMLMFHRFLHLSMPQH